jgi:hypothetical protein
MSVVGNTRIDKQSGRSPVQVRLIDCLRCSNALQFWWPIRSAHQHGHMCMICFHHCCMKLHGRGSRRAQQNSWHLVVLANA